MRVGRKGGVTTPFDPNEAKNAQKPQARRKNRKKYSNTRDARVITTPYSNPRKETIPPPRKRTESVTATPRTRSQTFGLAEPHSWASVALTHCLTHEWVTCPEHPEPGTYGSRQQLHLVGVQGRLTLAKPDW